MLTSSNAQQKGDFKQMIESDMKTELKNSRKPVNQSVDLSKTVKVNVTSIPDPTNFLQHTSSQESLSH